MSSIRASTGDCDRPIRLESPTGPVQATVLHKFDGSAHAFVIGRSAHDPESCESTEPAAGATIFSSPGHRHRSRWSRISETSACMRSSFQAQSMRARPQAQISPTPSLVRTFFATLRSMVMVLQCLQVGLVAASIALPPRSHYSTSVPTTDPFTDGSASTDIPSPDGPEWTAPPPPPPAPPPRIYGAEADADPAPTPNRGADPAGAASAEPDEAAPSGKPLVTGGIVLLALGAASAGLTYYTVDARRKAEAELSSIRQTNSVLLAAGLMPQGTSDAEAKIRRNRGLSVGFGIGAAVLLVTGGVLLLVGRSRMNRASRPITWGPRAGGIEVSF